MFRNLRIVLAPTFFAVLAATAVAQEAPTDDPLAQLREQIAAQQKVLEEQSRELEEQRKWQEEQLKRQEAQESRIEDQRQAIQALLQRVDELAAAGVGTAVPDSRSEYEVAMRERLESLEEQIANPPDQAAESLAADDFPGSIRIPGTNTALKIGGFVKLNYVQNLDPQGSDDRFITATIPTGEITGGEDSRSTLSTRESRFSFDVRRDSSVGVFRIFLEGDFAGADQVGGTDLYRLRHAYGQYKHLLVGKTWSTFMNNEAQPEGIDFEGLNGNIFARQPQLRYRIQKSEKNSYFLSLEDPRPSVTDGNAISQFADMVGAFRRSGEHGHFRVSAVLRQLRVRSEDDIQKTGATGWGAALSGRINFLKHNEDNLLYELSYGNGHGRYINDLNAEGGQDAIYDPVTNRLETLPAFSTFVAYQHWWGEVGNRLGFDNLRTTVVASLVDVNNLDIQPDNAYHRTFRASINLMWSPLTVIDIGAEYLWGQRTDKNRESGSASQFQFAAKYRF